MSYTPTNISVRDIETDEKVLKPSLVKANLDLIALETKLLSSDLKKIKDTIVSIETKTEPKMSPLVAALLFG